MFSFVSLRQFFPQDLVGENRKTNTTKREDKWVLCVKKKHEEKAKMNEAFLIRFLLYS